MKKRIKNTKILILVSILRFIPAYFCVALFFHFYGSFFAQALIPLFTNTIEVVYPDYQVTAMELDTYGGERVIRYAVKIQKESFFEQEEKRRIQISFIFYPAIIVFSLILAWPALSLKTRLEAALVSMPLLLALAIIDIPAHMVGTMEYEIFNRMITGYVEVSKTVKFVRYWNYFLNNGGTQFLALLVFILTVTPFHVLNSYTPESGISRNDPCPCGSGKKYKNCCMK